MEGRRRFRRLVGPAYRFDFLGSLGLDGFGTGDGALGRIEDGCTTLFIVGGPSESARSRPPFEGGGVDEFFDISKASAVVQRPPFDGEWVGVGFEGGGVGEGTFFIGGGGRPRSNSS